MVLTCTSLNENYTVLHFYSHKLFEDTRADESGHSVSSVYMVRLSPPQSDIDPTDALRLFFSKSIFRKPLQWIKVSEEGASNAPCARIAHTQVELDGKIWTFGGRYGVRDNEGALGDLHCFDPATDSWREVKAPNAPGPRSFHAMASTPGSLYVFGGCLPDHRRVSDLYRFDVASETWTELCTTEIDGTPFCVGRGGAAITASTDGKQLILVGGFSGEENGDMYIYNLTGDAKGGVPWVKVSDTALRLVTTIKCSCVDVCFNGVIGHLTVQLPVCLV